MMKFFYFPIALILICGAKATSQVKPPDLNGIWRWNPQKSNVTSPPNDARVKFEHNGPDLLLTWRVLTGATDEMQTAYYRIGSDDSRNISLQGIPMKSYARWQGTALAIDSAPASGRDGAQWHDLWTLSKNGQTIVFKGHRPELNEDAEARAKDDTIIFEKQADETWGPPQHVLAAAQVYKNIQIIREPAWRLPSGMMSLTRWLGVDCSFCHTLNEFERDDKEPKKIARKMFKMVHDINQDNFPGTEPGGFMVTCWTCHRGSVKPETSMPVAALNQSGR